MTEPTPNPERSLLDGFLYYLSILYKYRRMILITSGSVIFLTLAYAAASIVLPPDKSPMPNVYSARASILVQENSQNEIAATLLSGLGLSGGRTGPAIQSNGELILAILDSRAIIDPVIEKFHIASHYKLKGDVMSEARKLVRKKSKFEYAANTGIVTISYQDVNPTFSATIVNGMVSRLSDWFSQERDTAAKRHRTELETKIAQVRKVITDLQNRQKSLREKYGVLSASELGQSQATVLATLRAQLLLKEIDIKNYASVSRINDPRLQQMKDQRQNLIDLINQTENGGAVGVDTPGSGGNMASAAQEFSQLQHELDLEQKIYSALVPQLVAATLSPGPFFQVISLADVPHTKSGPKRSRLVIVAAFASIFGSIFLAFVLNTISEVKADPTKNIYFRRVRRPNR